MDADRAGDRFHAVRHLIRSGIAARAFPAAAIETGRRAGTVWRESFGTLTYEPDSRATDPGAIFDLASLTKVIVTTSVAMWAVRDGVLRLDTPVRELSPVWTRPDQASVTLRHLLDHSSGLPAHARLFDRVKGRDAFEREIAALPLDRPVGSSAIYSDPGFILLGLILERALGHSLDAAVAPLLSACDGVLTFRVRPDLIPQVAPTEVDPWRGRLVRAEVHDENAAALGGVAGHAGLFGTVAAVGAFAQLVLETYRRETMLGTPALLRVFTARSRVPDSTRALGWDTMKTTSSCGRLMSPAAIGHTGFTGTSLWIDPEQDLYVVLLTNRVHPSREPNRFAPMRAPIHDAVIEALEDDAPGGPSASSAT